MTDDVDLAPRLAAGDPAAFARLYDLHGAGIYGYLRARLGEAHLAEDLVQRVLLRVVRSRDRLRRVANLRGYLFAAARNELARHLADKRANRAPGEDAHPAELRSCRDPAPADETLALALARLAPERREVVELHLHHDLTFAEIGAVLSISPNTASSRYRLALQDLRRMLETADVVR